MRVMMIVKASRECETDEQALREIGAFRSETP